MLCAAQATVTVPQRAQASGQPRGGHGWLGRCWTTPKGGADPCWPPRVALPPQKLPALAGHITTDDGARPKDHEALWIRRGNREQAAIAVTGEIDIVL